MNKKKYKVERLNSNHEKQSFDCGIHELDIFLKTQANQQAKKKLGTTYVCVEDGASEILGYYTLAATSIALGDLPNDLPKKLPRYPTLPAILLGRLAIKKSAQGKSFGSALLYDALQRSLDFSDQVGSIAVVVEAINEPAVSFYRKHGFISFEEMSDKLFLPMVTIKKLVSNNSNGC